MIDRCEAKCWIACEPIIHRKCVRFPFAQTLSWSFGRGGWAINTLTHRCCHRRNTPQLVTCQDNPLTITPYNSIMINCQITTLLFTQIGYRLQSPIKNKEKRYLIKTPIHCVLRLGINASAKVRVPLKQPGQSQGNQQSDPAHTKPGILT